MHLTPWHVVGLLATIVLIIGVGIYSGRKVRSAADFASGGGKAGAWIVCGAIMGTLVSGQATIGTAQLAFNYGMSAWWFTLGSGIGCLILALGYAAPLRHSGCSTLLQIVSREYGPRAETWGSVLSSIGIFISVVAQILSATALLITIFPVSHLAAALDLHPPHGGVRHVPRGVGRRHGRRGETHFALCLPLQAGCWSTAWPTALGACWRRWSTCW